MGSAALRRTPSRRSAKRLQSWPARLARPTGALGQRDDAVGIETGPLFLAPVRPADLDAIHRLGGPQPDVDAQVVLRVVAATATDLADLHHAARSHADPG